MATYRVTVGDDERMRFEADFSRASDQIMVVGEDGPVGTPFRVADARHRPERAADLLNGWCRREGGEAWGEGEEAEVEAVD